MGAPPALAADWTLVDGRLLRDCVLRLDDGGRIASVEVAPALADGTPVQRLRGRVLLPGFVNAHSHAFQRLMRGRTEFRSAVGEAGSAPDDFWSWRAAMYALTESLSPDDIEIVSQFAYMEMLRAGFTHVAEFHYLHHGDGGAPYADAIETSRRVLAAAGHAGIGVTLLRVAYQRGGWRSGASREQLRFCDRDPEVYARRLDDTRSACMSAERDSRGLRPVRAGIAAHSVRALDGEWLRALGRLASSGAAPLPLHAHVAEQAREVEQCFGETGRSPVQHLADCGLLGPRFTAVHATHLEAGEAGLLGDARAAACICPTTERNLGDGLPALEPLHAAGVTLCLGSDSHARIDPFAELRGLEDGERLRTRRRNVLVGERGQVAPVLFAAAAAGGARSLGLDAGEIAPGQRADLVALRIDEDPALAGAATSSRDGDALFATLMLAGTASLVSDVWVGGSPVVEDRSIRGWDAARRAFEAVAARYGGQ
jgi:formimidoylglutamate deiminase